MSNPTELPDLDKLQQLADDLDGNFQFGAADTLREIINNMSCARPEVEADLPVLIELPDGDKRKARCVFQSVKDGKRHLCVVVEPDQPEGESLERITKEIQAAIIDAATGADTYMAALIAAKRICAKPEAEYWRQEAAKSAARVVVLNRQIAAQQAATQPKSTDD